MLLGLIGEDIFHSGSPGLHARLGRLAGVDVTYDLFDSAQSDLGSVEKQVRTLVDRGYRGINVTHPFKEDAVQVATQLSPDVRMVGATNTLIFDSAVRIRAENTDISGFISAYRSVFGVRAPERVLLLGTGGVGKAVAFALGKLGASEIILLDLDRRRAELLADELNERRFRASCTDESDLEAAIESCDGLVNCSPVGHESMPGCPFPKMYIRPRHWVFDAVYVPAITEFTAVAREAGAQVLDGASLFVFQGADAFKLFCQSSVRRQQVDRLAGSLLDDYRRELLDNVSQY